MMPVNVSAPPSEPRAWATQPSSSSLSDLLGSGADLAFVVYAMQIQQLDGLVRQSLDEVAQIQKLRTAVNQQLAELRNWKAHIAQHGSGDGDARKISLLDYNDNPDTPQIVQKDFSVDSDGSIRSTSGPALGTATTRSDWDKDNVFREHSYHEVSIADIDKEINRLQGIAQGWDSDREIKMIMMNQHLNKKEQAVTLLTNFIKKAHDTQSAVIANLK